MRMLLLIAVAVVVALLLFAASVLAGARRSRPALPPGSPSLLRNTG